MMRGRGLRLSKWICKSKKCPLRGDKEICGDGGSGPIIISYHRVGEGEEECYLRHVMLCWDEWNRISKRYLPSIQRVTRRVLSLNLKFEHLRRMCGLMILHHDIGKLSENYQTEDKNKRFYRHEMLSVHLLYEYMIRMMKEETDLNEQVRELLASIIAASVYLHHEALQLSHHHFEMRAPTYAYLLNLLTGREFLMVRKWKEIAMKLELWALKTAHGYFTTATKINGDKVARTLASIMTLIDGHPKPLAIRLGISTLLQLLTIVDNRAALARGGKLTRFTECLGVLEI